MQNENQNRSQKTPHNPAGRGWMRRFLVRLFCRDDGWVKSELIAQDGQTIYGVRDKPGHEREVQDRWGRWKPQSQAKFSVLTCFEEYHRRRYFTAVPFPHN
jgi:hypothetical protein